MKIQDQMKQLLDETPDLELLALGDLSSGLILNWAAKSRCRREVLDVLAEMAAACLGLPVPDSLPSGVNMTTFGASMVRFTESETQIFARHAVGAEDVICAIGKPAAAIAPLLHVVEDLAHKIGGSS